MITALLSIFGLILAFVVMTISAYVASRIETIDIQGKVCIMLNSNNTGIAYTNAVIAAVFSGVILAIFIISIILDMIHEIKKEDTPNITSQMQQNRPQQQEVV